MNIYNYKYMARFAAVKKWKDNPKDIQVMEYFEEENDAKKWIKKQKKDTRFKYDVMIYI
jgi:hypothetical protein